MVGIEIGGGTIPTAGYHNLDPRHGEGEWRRIIQDGIPMPDSSVDNVRASHIMEHVPAGQVRIDVFNEVHRVLRPGGEFYIIVPLLVGTWHAIADPTHVSYWVVESFHYFDGLFAANADYGIKLWQTTHLEVLHGWEGHWKGTPVK